MYFFPTRDNTYCLFHAYFKVSSQFASKAHFTSSLKPVFTRMDLVWRKGALRLHCIKKEMGSPGRCCITGISCLRSSSAFPTPDSRRSCGEFMAPPLRMTSLSAKTWCQRKRYTRVNKSQSFIYLYQRKWVKVKDCWADKKPWSVTIITYQQSVTDILRTVDLLMWWESGGKKVPTLQLWQIM